MTSPTTDAEKAFEYDAAKRSLAKAGRHGGLVYELVHLLAALGWYEAAADARRTTPPGPALAGLRVLGAPQLPQLHGRRLMPAADSQVRRFVAVIQDPKGYPPVGVTLNETIAAPVMVSVVREDDFERLREEHAALLRDYYEMRDKARRARAGLVAAFRRGVEYRETTNAPIQSDGAIREKLIADEPRRFDDIAARLREDSREAGQEAELRWFREGTNG